MKRRTDWRAIALNWTSAALFAALFLGITALLDRDVEQAHALVAHAQQLQAIEVRMNIGALALCESDLGPGALPGWTPEGDLVCLSPSTTPTTDSATLVAGRAAP